MNPLEDDPDPTPAELGFWDAGEHPPWKRLWVGGVDVTDRPVDEWPLERITQGYRTRGARRSRRA